MGGQHHAAATLLPGQSRYTLCRMLGGSQGPSGRVWKNVAPITFDPKTISSRYTNLFFVLYLYFFVLIALASYLLSSLCNTHNTNIHAPGRIRTLNPSKQTTADPRLRLLGHCDRLSYHGPHLQLTKIYYLMV